MTERPMIPDPNRIAVAGVIGRSTVDEFGAVPWDEPATNQKGRKSVEAADSRPSFRYPDRCESSQGAKIVSDSWIPPIILFSEEELIAGRQVMFGYLIRIDGRAWAYPSDAMTWGKVPGLAGAIRLDPLRIVEETSSETGQKSYAYRPAPP
jgi:hypothetical protein